MKIIAKTKQEYLDNVGARAEDLLKVDALLLKFCPSLKPLVHSGMSGSWLAYGMMPYKSKDYDEWPLLALAAQKHHMALYVCAVKEGKYFAEFYEKELGKVSVGKSCIRFKKFEDLNIEGLIKMLKELEIQYKKGEVLFGN